MNHLSRELQKYRSIRKDVHATYIMIGTPPSRYGFDSDPSGMEIDEEAVRKWEENIGGEAVQERLMLLVSEDELEGESCVRNSALKFG